MTLNGSNVAAALIVALGLAAAGFLAAASQWLPATLACTVSASLATNVISRRKRLTAADSTGPATVSNTLLASMIGLLLLGILISVIWNAVST